ncbi:MAG: metallophosphoesterase family protein [Thermodesulfobacteriota bacterium]|nr:metallophosphoesterase family protein [Thermodesulfobacteriota bacterium]
MKGSSVKKYTLAAVVALAVFPAAAQASSPVIIPELPVVDPGSELTIPLSARDGSIRNPITWEQIHTLQTPNTNNEGLYIDLGMPEFYGTIYTGPYPIEYGRRDGVYDADYDYQAFRKNRNLEAGAGSLRIDDYFKDKYNANGWPEGQCDNPDDCPTRTIAYRLHLLRDDDNGNPVDIGFYDGRTSFTGTAADTFQPALTIIEGPFINQVKSNGPRKVMVNFETNESCAGSVFIREQGITYSEADNGTDHEIMITGLKPDSTYHYQSFCNGDEVRSGVYDFKTAPKKGKLPADDGTISVVFGSDSREGAGGGERRYMGHNLYTLNRIASEGYHLNNVDLGIFGGDLINGYTSDKDDFILQFKGWKKAWEGLWRHVPIYPAMGNHETLHNVFDDGSDYGLSMDKWPYETDSAEAVFAQEFFNPTNGPKTKDKRRPTYKENVYSFQYGPALFIAFNNNYWWTTNNQIETFGGSPEGYIMNDQLKWIERKLAKAENDKTIDYIFLYAQEPVFPNGGHVKDAMWWKGDNNIKAWTKKKNGKMKPAAQGIIEVRNRFWTAIAESSKVAAVLTGDEHGYHRMVVDSETPVGIMSDDLNGNNKIDWYVAEGEEQENVSPNPSFTHATYHITSGNAGAPWYSKELTPWSDHVDVFSSQIGYTILDITADGVKMTAYSLDGGVIDYVPNLMDVK